MKKSKILIVLLALVLLVGLALGVSVSAVAASTVTDADWISAPSKTLTKCEGGTCDHTACDYVYSFAVVGDTQNLNYIDAENYVEALKTNPSLTPAAYTAAHMKTLYNWILENQSSKNIQYVMGLGDITQSFNTSQTYYDEEWALAKEALALLDGKLGYSLVRGNHDISSGLNGTFGVGNRYHTDLKALSETTDAEGRPMAGFLDAEKIEDTYRKITISNGDKYIIFTLDYYPTEACLAWLDSTLSENSDYTAIITLHAFLTKDGSMIDDYETTTPAEDKLNSSWSQTATGGNVSPKELWNSLYEHENVSMILGGHVDVDDIVYTQLKGKNGNTVTCMLIDGQTIDKEVEPVGLVTMFYVSADGKVVNVEHISTVRAEAGENAYLKAKNQFALTVDYDSWQTTPYGFVPKSLYDAHTFHVLLDDDSSTDTTATYFGSYDTWDAVSTAIHAFNGIGGTSTRSLKTWNVVVSKNCQSISGLSHNTYGKNPGKTVVDLMDNTFAVSSGHVIFPFYNQHNTFQPRIELKNGNVTLAQNAKIAVLQTSIENTGSVIDLTLSDLNIKINGTGASVVSHYDGSDYKSSANLYVTDCTIDASTSGGANTLFALENTKYNNSDVTLTLTGGSIVGDTAANLTVATVNEGNDKVYYAVGESGKYPTLTLNEASANLSGLYRASDGKLLRYKTAVASGSAYLYEMEEAPVEETSYGNIPTDIYPAESYPFALFIGGELRVAYATWYDFCQSIYAFDTSEANGATLYVRGSVTVDKTSNQLRNVKYLTVDLGSNTVSSNATLFNFMADGNYDFTTNITVKNGTVTMGKAWAPLIAYNSANTEDVDCRFNMTFDKVTVNATSGFSGRLLIEAWKDGTYGTKNTAVFNDCIFDVTTGTVSKLFQLEESNSQNKVDVAVSFNGGKLLANSYFTLGSFSAERESGKGSPDTLTLSNDFALVMPSTVAHPTSGITTTVGELYPIETVDDGTNATYYFRSIATQYGTIPTDKLSAVDYPFVVFQNKEWVASYQKWNSGGVIQGLAGLDTSEAKQTVVLLRRDYNTTEYSGNSYGLNAVDTFTLDLGGHTFTRGNNHMFQLYAQDNDANANITVKNGTVCAEKNYAAPININGSSSTEGLSIVFNMTFNDVTFTSTEAYVGRLIVEPNNGGTYGSTVNLVFNGCEFIEGGTGVDDFFRLRSQSNASGGKYDINVTVNGGSFTLVEDISIISSYKDAEDSIKFGAYDGAYSTFIKKAGAAAPTDAFTAVNGKSLSLRDDSTTTAAIFQLGEDIKTEYGTIPFAYANENTYPFVLFKNGSFVSAHADYYNTSKVGVMKDAIAAGSATTDKVTVLMRGDYTNHYDSTAKNMINTFNTLAGKLTLDLGGNTIYSDGELMKFNLKNSNDVRVDVTNGTVVITARMLMGFSTQSTSVEQHLDLTFTDVNIYYRSVSDSVQYPRLMATDAAATYEGGFCSSTVTFNSCVIDFTEAKLSSGTEIIIFNCTGDTKSTNAINVVYNGGEIIGSKDYTMTLAGLNTNPLATDTFNLGKYEGNYPKITLSKTATAPTNVYDSTELAFVELSSDADTVTYGLLPKAIVDFKPQTSITLDANLIFNVYIPENAYLTEITLDGKTVKMSDLEASDGKYRLTVELPAAEAGREIPLTVTFGDEASATYTLSVLKYAEKLLASSTSTAEKALICDMLAYVKSAYAYFGTGGAEQIASAIDALIGDGASSFEKISDTNGSMAVGAGVNGVTFILDAEPKIRFYFAQGTDLTNYSFKIGGVAQEYTETAETIGESTFVCADISLFAYKMIGTVEVYNGSTKLGSFHINDYHAFALTQNNSALVEVVERFYMYCKSAKAYRDEVIGDQRSQ